MEVFNQYSKMTLIIRKCLPGGFLVSLTKKKPLRLDVCERLLSHYEEEGENILHHILTYDETWVHHYNSKASMEWKKKGKAVQVKTKTR